MITLPGHLAIKTIHGRNGDFNVGRLATSIGEFVVKNAELDQYNEGKYDGDFTISNIRACSYSTNGRLVFEVRAMLASMAISGINDLPREEARRFNPQEVDPADEENPRPQVPPPASTPTPPSPPDSATPKTPARQKKTLTPFPFGEALKSKSAETNDEADQKLFGTNWPLGTNVKLDVTVDRITLRQQSARLRELGYEPDPRDQSWHLNRKAA